MLKLVYANNSYLKVCNNYTWSISMRLIGHFPPCAGDHRKELISEICVTMW